MKRLIAMAAAAAFYAAPASAVEIEVGYPYSLSFDVTFEKIMETFRKEHPEIEVNFRATYENYEDGTNTILREAVSGNLPDVTMQGLNRQAVLVEKGIAKSLQPFIDKEANFETDGYHQAMLTLSTFNNEVYGLPFAVSLPVGYYNMDLMKKAGIETLPKTWDEVVALCSTLRENGSKIPLFWGWNITGNWFMQSLMWDQGEPIIKDGKVNFDGEAGLTSLETMKKIFRGCEMPNLNYKEALTAFSAGDVAMLYWSTSAVGSVERSKGDFVLQTAEFPGINGKPQGLPAGGNAALLVSTSEDPERLHAAWTFLKYITSGIGAAAVAETTGYMPPNKAANEVILKDFYKNNPNKETAVRQLPLLRDWLAYPGDKGLAVTQVLYDGIESIVTGEEDDMKALQSDLVAEVGDMLPK
ncbi:ABC transporter substrate-binding protein [uncultured Nisaea sp.]|uniref:ABC transporter substrate-binding protein n=1 Tax=uncultured Nisaea sp. TaxID=538215 RepID=UPI0030EBAC49|tara:strand:+ start:414 stop:1652 length:1239 start_codon:yes stop_codon:yes gene_type:complete